MQRLREIDSELDSYVKELAAAELLDDMSRYYEKAPDLTED